MKFEVRKIKNPTKGREWGIFLKKEYCKTDEPVCYGSCYTKKAAESACKRQNKEHGEENV